MLGINRNNMCGSDKIVVDNQKLEAKMKRTKGKEHNDFMWKPNVGENHGRRRAQNQNLLGV